LKEDHRIEVEIERIRLLRAGMESSNALAALEGREPVFQSEDFMELLDQLKNISIPGKSIVNEPRIIRITNSNNSLNSHMNRL